MNAQSVDILCITAHPDDVEISCGGTVLRHIDQGHSVGLVELTAGELGTRGSSELRRREAEAAREVLGAAFRYDIGLPDGFFATEREDLQKVVQVIRRHRPKLVITNAIRDRHPDHGRGAELVARACFLSGLRRMETHDGREEQEPWRPTTVLHAIQDNWIDPDLVVDVTPFWERRAAALMCFRSQFYDPTSTEPESPIASSDFLPFLEGRMRAFGRIIHTTYGEGFTVARAPGVKDLMDLS
ncbi:MAG: bacillithiol biosynthesis deacetylase BshB1 [Flavobacteriales bacterium]|nr:bacillithiol biosynthesis deacetylase BshB1 [Flavobacteriales bacterium]MBK9288386.1 bacillithiol biosynthesis deacetylase BshB1 [Flavobacteriales bacterium]